MALLAFLLGLVLAAVLILPFVLLAAWILMLLLGALASMLAIPALAIGFGPCFVIALICGLLF